MEMQIIRTVCDIHMAREEMADALGTTTVTVDKKTIQIDLCRECKDQLDTAITEVFRLGRRPDAAATPAPRARRTKEQITADRAAAAEAAAGSPEKVNKGHGGATYGEYHCDVEGCDREFNTAQGLSMHKIRGHRPKAVAEAA